MDSKKIKRDIKKNGYCIIPEFIDLDSAKEIRSIYFNILKSCPLHSQNDTFHFEDLKLDPWRKTAVGSSNGLGTRISQVLQTTYVGETFFPRKSTISKVIHKIITLRNLLTNVEPDFGSNPKENRYWNALRFHHYPCGGGHMSQHRDSHFPKILAKVLSLPLCAIPITNSSTPKSSAAKIKESIAGINDSPPSNENLFCPTYFVCKKLSKLTA